MYSATTLNPRRITHYLETFISSGKFKKERKNVLTETQTENVKTKNPRGGLLHEGSGLKVAVGTGLKFPISTLFIFTNITVTICFSAK